MNQLQDVNASNEKQEEKLKNLKKMKQDFVDQNEKLSIHLKNAMMNDQSVIKGLEKNTALAENLLQ